MGCSPTAYNNVMENDMTKRIVREDVKVLLFVVLALPVFWVLLIVLFSFGD